MVALRVKDLVDVLSQEVTARVIRIEGDLNAVIVPPALLVFFEKAQGIVLHADEEIEAVVRGCGPRHHDTDVVVRLLDRFATGGEHALGREDEFLIDPAPVTLVAINGHGAGIGHTRDEILCTDVCLGRDGQGHCAHSGK